MSLEKNIVPNKEKSLLNAESTERIGKVFRKSDIRGRVPEEVDALLFYAIGKVIGRGLALEGGFIPTLVIGTDIRPHGLSLESVIMQGARSVASPVFVSIGQTTTPVVQVLSADPSVSIALMITASHNPIEYNGLKIYGGGSAIPSQAFSQFKSAVEAQYLELLSNQSPIPKEETTCHIFAERALQFYFGRINCIENLANVPSRVVFKTLLSPKYERVYGTFMENFLGLRNFRFFVNKEKEEQHSFNPTDSKFNKALVDEIKQRAESDTIGIMFDGDADRVAFVNETGTMVDASTIACIFAKHNCNDQGWKGRTIVMDSSIPPQVKDFIESLGYSVIVTATGQSSIVEAARNAKAIFAFESSGHITFYDKGSMVDDGFFVALRMLELMAKTGKSLVNLIEELDKTVTTIFKQTRTLQTVKALDFGDDILELANNEDLDKNFSSQTFDGQRICFKDGRMLLVRKSNTEDVLRILVTGPDNSSVESLTDKIEKLMREKIEA